jgi:hypothetical protein
METRDDEIGGRFGSHSAADQLRETAVAFVLIEERELVAIEPLEPFVPVDSLERAGAAVAGKIDTQNAGIVFLSGAFYARRVASARFDPLLDFGVIRGCR